MIKFNCLFVPGHDAWRNRLLTLLTAYDYVKTSATILIPKMIFHANHVDATPMDLESRRSKMFGSCWRWGTVSVTGAWPTTPLVEKSDDSGEVYRLTLLSQAWLSGKPEFPSGNGLKCCCSGHLLLWLCYLFCLTSYHLLSLVPLSPFCACFIFPTVSSVFLSPSLPSLVFSLAVEPTNMKKISPVFRVKIPTMLEVWPPSCNVVILHLWRSSHVNQQHGKPEKSAPLRKSQSFPWVS